MSEEPIKKPSLVLVDAYVPEDLSYKEPQPERRRVLTLWLLLNFFLNGVAVLGVASILSVLHERNRSFNQLPGTAQIYLIGGAIYTVVSTICLIGMWRFKRWGVYGLVFMVWLKFAIEPWLNANFGLTEFIQPFGWSLLLAFVVRKQWDDFT